MKPRKIPASRLLPMISRRTLIVTSKNSTLRAGNSQLWAAAGPCWPALLRALTRRYASRDAPCIKTRFLRCGTRGRTRGRRGLRSRSDRSNERTGNECVASSGGIGGCDVDRSQRAQEAKVLIPKVLNGCVEFWRM